MNENTHHIADVDFCNVESVLRYKYTESCYNTQARNNLGKDHAHDITVRYLMQVFIKQRGRCAVSGIPFPMTNDKHWVVSIDRLNNDVGYIEGNIQLVCEAFNVTAGFTADKFNAIYHCIKRKYSLE